MTDQSKKRDAGKAAYHLIPWNEFQAIAIDHPVEAVDQALKMWWSSKPCDLELSIPVRQLPGIARVLAFGAEKYPPRGWEDGIQYSRLFAAACRHAAYVVAGDLVDDESGLAHQSHFWCNVLFLIVFTARCRTDLDDRPAPVASVMAYMDNLKAQMSKLRAAVGLDAAPTPRDPQKAN